MSSIQLLRVLLNERLSAAADEIFEAVKKTIAGYEEEILLSKREIRRQRRMLETVLKPDIKINKLAGLSVCSADSSCACWVKMCGWNVTHSHRHKAAPSTPTLLWKIAECQTYFKSIFALLLSCHEVGTVLKWTD